MGNTSKSGPVRIIATFTPEPPTPAQQRARLQHKLALLEDRIADREAFIRQSPHTRGFHASHKQLDTLHRNKQATIRLLRTLPESGE